MKKIMMILVIGVAGMVFAQGVVTKGARYDDTTTAGTVYVGKTQVNSAFAKTSTVEQIEAANVWMIKKYTSTGCYISGGDENAYVYSWTNRAHVSTNIIWYK